MENDDFNPFIDLNDNPFLLQYLEAASQSHNIPTDAEEVEMEFVDHQNSEAGVHDAIPDLPMDPEPETGEQGQHLPNKKRTELKDDERQTVYGVLLQESVNGKLKKSSTTQVSEDFNMSIRSVQRLWKRGRESEDHNISLNRVKKYGRKRIQLDLDKIGDIPLRKRTTLRDLAAASGVSRRNLCTKLKSGEIKRHSNSIKPILTEANRLQKIAHCLSMLDPDTLTPNQSFQEMSNVVHIDEKWFQMTKKTQTYYLLAGEDDPVRTIKSTNFIPKIIFLAAVARPRYDSDGNCTFDGKIGVFPLVTEVAAVRSSANRLAGTLEIKAIDKIDRQVIRQFMISKVLPAIRDKWPTENIENLIIIQQDNAKTHILPDDVDFYLAANELGLNVKLLCQPPNSPDLNVLDLGFFRAIQSLQEKKCARSVVELVAAVDKSFHEFSVRKSNYIFITLQSCMVEILKILRSNTYKIPHMSKECLERKGLLPSRLSCDSLIIETARANLLQ